MPNKITQDINDDSKLLELINSNQPSNIAHTKTDIFREQIQYNQTIKDQLKNARDDNSIDKLQDIQNNLGNLEDAEFGVLIDLFLSYRDIKAYNQMISLVKMMPKVLSNSIMVQEQLGFALNRVGKDDEAIRVLEDLITTHGKSSETCGILGRVYKDKYNKSEKANENQKAKAFLKKAIDTYLDGFEADKKDAYPGINALTLMDIAQDDRFEEVYPMVLNAVKQKMQDSTDYWDYATLLELYILNDDPPSAKKILSELLANKRFDWEIETTINNLTMIKDSRVKNDANIDLVSDIIDRLKSSC